VLSKEGDISAFLAETALAAALRQEKEAKEEVGKLELKLRELSRVQAGGGEASVPGELRPCCCGEGGEGEERGRGRDQGRERLATRLERSEASPRAASEKAESLSAQVAALQEQSLRGRADGGRAKRPERPGGCSQLRPQSGQERR